MYSMNTGTRAVLYLGLDVTGSDFRESWFPPTLNGTSEGTLVQGPVCATRDFSVRWVRFTWEIMQSPVGRLRRRRCWVSIRKKKTLEGPRSSFRPLNMPHNKHMKQKRTLADSHRDTNILNEAHRVEFLFERTVGI
jgi:hypothetical protein